MKKLKKHINLLYKISLLICLFLINNNTYAYQFTVNGYVYNALNENFQENQLIIFEFSDTTLIDSSFTDSYGYYEKTFEINSNANKSYNLKVSTIDICFEDINWYFDLETYPGLISDVNFDICYYSDDCQADFDYYEIGYKSLQFLDYSFAPAGIKSWFWNFGDGATSVEQNPTHTFENAGIQLVTLTTFSFDSCESTTFYSIFIEEEKSIEGLVYLKDSILLPKGRVYAYTVQPNESSYELALNTSFEVTNGFFSINYLYLQPTLLYVIPEFDLDDLYYPTFFPTYYHHEKNDSAYYWEYRDNYYSEDSLAIINLISYDTIFYGKGSVKGAIDFHEHEIATGQEICVLLLNEDFKPVKYTFSFFDEFELNNIPYGNYNLLIDIIGLPSKPLPITISESNPDINVTFALNSDTLTFIPDKKEYSDFKIAPNPFSNKISIVGENEFKGNSYFTITNISGKNILAGKLRSFTQEETLDLSTLIKGVYILQIVSNNKIFTKKIIKQ